MQYSTLQSITKSGLYKNFTDSNLVKTGGGVVVGVVVNSHTSGTLKLWDNTTAATTVLFNTITFPTGFGVYDLFGAKFFTGLYASVGGTADITLIYN
ncbi:MAG: hypothetical protein WCO06_01515 [Candidatus Roizmanbacteria bacterium]